MKKGLTLILLAAFAVSAYAVFQFGKTGSAPQSSVSYKQDIQPIFESRCTQCHSGRAATLGLHLESYTGAMHGSEYGAVIVPGNAEESLLVEKLLAGEMPKRGPKLTSAQIQTIIDWINAGAPNN
jgi:mono/diheme cytochrome c family protein